MSYGLNMANRHVNEELTIKYGKTMQKNPGNTEAAPVSIQIDEDFTEEKRTSLHPFTISKLCAKELVHKQPLSARERTLRDQTLKGKPQGAGTLASWQKTCLSGKAKNFQKPAFVPQAVPPLPLS